MPYITTYSGHSFDPLFPERDKIDIRDIAHALSLLCRANGHFPTFYSIAQHSLHCLAEAVARGRIKAPGFFSDPIIRKAYVSCSWNGPARTNLNPVQEVDAAIKRQDAGFSTAQEETAQMTGGDYNRNIKQRAIEVARMQEVNKIKGQAAQPAPVTE